MTGPPGRGAPDAACRGGLRFEMSCGAAGPPSTSGRSLAAPTPGELLLCTVAPRGAQACRRRGGGRRRAAIGGGFACVTSAALGHVHQSRRAHAAALLGGAKAALVALPESGRRLLAGALAGKVRGRLAAAAWAGAVSKTATAPLETVRMQMMTGKGSFGDVVRATWAQGGVLAFFSGNSADVLRTMPSKAIELASFDLYKRLLATGQQEGAAPGGLATAAAGGLAGVTSTVALFPLETARTRLAVSHRQYRGTFDCLSRMARAEGLGSWYKGLDASLIGVIPYAAVRLGMYDGLKWAHMRVTGEQHVSAQHSMLFGALAAVTSATVSFPLEVVRRRMMLGTARGGTLAALTAIAREEGLASLYKGVGLTWLKQAPQYAVTFCCYDLAKAWLAGQAEAPAPAGA